MPFYIGGDGQDHPMTLGNENNWDFFFFFKQIKTRTFFSLCPSKKAHCVLKVGDAHERKSELQFWHCYSCCTVRGWRKCLGFHSPGCLPPGAWILEEDTGTTAQLLSRSAVCSAPIYQIGTGFVSGYRRPHHAEIFKEMSASLTAIFRSTQKLLVHQKGKTLKICSSPEQPCNQTS